MCSSLDFYSFSKLYYTWTASLFKGLGKAFATKLTTGQNLQNRMLKIIIQTVFVWSLKHGRTMMYLPFIHLSENICEWMAFFGLVFIRGQELEAGGGMRSHCFHAHWMMQFQCTLVIICNLQVYFPMWNTGECTCKQQPKCIGRAFSNMWGNSLNLSIADWTTNQHYSGPIHSRKDQNKAHVLPSLSIVFPFDPPYLNAGDTLLLLSKT